jgi:hypothetical protein
MKLAGTSFIPVLAAAVVSACSGDGGEEPLVRNFTVTIENVSQANTIDSDRADGAVPLSAGVYAVYGGSNPLFTVGQAADEGTERLAEDGFINTKLDALDNLSGVDWSGGFQSAGGPDDGPAIFPGESVSFSFQAAPGQKLQIEVMFVQSNDWFYAFGADGLNLFDGNTAITGDVTDQIVLYDAGTEEDTAPGTGPNQKPAQNPTDIDIGPEDDDNTVRVASGFTIPSAGSVLRVTITASTD